MGKRKCSRLNSVQFTFDPARRSDPIRYRVELRRLHCVCSLGCQSTPHDSDSHLGTEYGPVVRSPTNENRSVFFEARAVRIACRLHETMDLLVENDILQGYSLVSPMTFELRVGSASSGRDWSFLKRIHDMNQLKLLTILVALVIQPFLLQDVVGDDIFAVQSRLSTPNFQLFLELNDDSSVMSTGPLFSPAGGVYGMTFLDDAVFGIELENGTFTDYLVTIPHEGPLAGQGSRVSTNPVGFPSVESLANVNSQLFATSLDFPGHMTTLITVDATTGIGTAVGSGARDVMIVGLAYDPSTDTLFGAGTPFGSLVDDPNLYTFDLASGNTTLVGNMGQGIQSLTWHEELGLIGGFDGLYQIDPSTGTASSIGTGDFTDGKPDSLNGLYSLASPSPDITPPACDFNGDNDCSIEDIDILYGQPGLTDQQISGWLISSSAADPTGRVFRSGDTNLDGLVDFADFLSLSGNFGIGPDSTWGMGNFTADGEVNFADFLALSGNFGFGVANTQTVPEPKSAFAWLSSCGLLFLSLVRKQQSKSFV